MVGLLQCVEVTKGRTPPAGPWLGSRSVPESKREDGWLAALNRGRRRRRTTPHPVAWSPRRLSQGKKWLGTTRRHAECSKMRVGRGLARLAGEGQASSPTARPPTGVGVGVGAGTDAVTMRVSGAPLRVKARPITCESTPDYV